MIRAALLSVVLLAGTAAQADDSSPTPPPESIALTGAIRNPESMTRDDLMKLPPIDVTVNQQTDKGQLTGIFRGALLWTIVQQAEPVDGPEKNAYLKHVFLVGGADGYAAAVSDGEINPKLENKQVIVAYQKDGAPFEGFRLIVPGDAHAARSVQDIAIIEVK
ncbi:MAG TPA: hypothetical protein VG889_16040 [Rhizomicrobium sp.]|nr:hypothetical protein [Rhizomicrobium sp.]